MTKAELLEILDYIDDDDEVLFISQPDRRPLVYRIDGRMSSQYADKVYLVEGSQVGSVDSDVSKALQLGW